MIRELYNLTDLDETFIDAIAINHVISQLDEQVRQDVKMLQLAGNKSLERWLELINDKLSGNPLFSNYVQVSAAEHSRLDKMECLIEKLAVKVDALSGTSKARVTCANCGKFNHSEDNCFKLKTCFKCKEKGHIARFCKADNAEYKTASSIVPAAVQQVKPSKRLFLKVNISRKELMFLHDTGSQFLIITRDDYDRLPTKPPLQKVEQSGVGLNLHSMVSYI